MIKIQDPCSPPSSIRNRNAHLNSTAHRRRDLLSTVLHQLQIARYNKNNCMDPDFPSSTRGHLVTISAHQIAPSVSSYAGFGSEPLNNVMMCTLTRFKCLI